MIQKESHIPISCRFRGAAEHLLRYPWRMWYFGDDVGLEGLLAAGDILKDSRFSVFVYGLGKAWAARADKREKYDQTLPGLPLLNTAVLFEDQTLVERLKDFAGWLIAHPVRDDQILVDDDFPDKVWVDCMSFHGPFLAKLGQITRSYSYFDEACRFILPLARVLRDQSGLYCHTYDTVTRTVNAVHWGRGQGWALRGLWETYRWLPKASAHKEEILGMFRELMHLLAEWQRSSGHWGTVIDVEDAYEETSVAAFFVAVGSSAYRHGILGDEFVKPISKAWEAVKDSLDERGRYHGVSEDTWSGNVAYYLSRPVADTAVPWGEGIALVAGREFLETFGSL